MRQRRLNRAAHICLMFFFLVLVAGQIKNSVFLQKPGFIAHLFSLTLIVCLGFQVNLQQRCQYFISPVRGGVFALIQFKGMDSTKTVTPFFPSIHFFSPSILLCSSQTQRTGDTLLDTLSLA